MTKKICKFCPYWKREHGTEVVSNNGYCFVEPVATYRMGNDHQCKQQNTQSAEVGNNEKDS